MTHFIYKYNPDIVSSLSIDNSKCNINTSSFRTFRSGILYDEDYMDVISVLSPIIITEEQYKGFMLLNNINISTMKKMQVYGGNLIELDLSEKEKTYVTSILKLFEKFKIRLYIEKEIGDLNDTVADLSKKLSLLERIIINIVNNNEDILKTLPEELQSYVIELNNKISNGELYLIYDSIKETKENIVDYYINTIAKREQDVSKGIKDYYDNK